MSRARRPARGYLTPQEVADLLMVSPITVRQWAQKGWLEAHTTPGGHRRFKWRHIELFARQRGLALHLSDGATLRVLLVDSDPGFLSSTADAIGTADGAVAVSVAGSCFDAGQKVRSFVPDILVLDLDLPGLDGQGVCQQLKGDPLTRAIDIIATAQQSSREAAARIVEAGARTCLSKPFPVDLLLRELGIRSLAVVNG